MKTYSALAMADTVIKRFEEADVKQLQEYAGFVFVHIDPSLKDVAMLKTMMGMAIVTGPRYFLLDMYNGIMGTSILDEEVEWELAV